MKKRMISMLLLLAMLLSIVPAASAAEAASGTCGENLTWTLDDSGTLTISGTGEMTDFNYVEAPWYGQCENILAVVIEDGVTSIGDYAFAYCNSLTSITIPGSVTSIGSGAFYDCDSLTSVTILDGVTSIGDDAFYECASLTSVTIPDSVTTIGNSAFRGCKGLADENGFVIVHDILFDYYGDGGDVVIPDGVTTIGNWAFSDCSSLTSITIPDSVTTIGDGAFIGCYGLADENGFVIVHDILFDYYGAGGTVVIPDSVTTIGDSAFQDCESLTSVTIPDSITTIGDSAFYLCDSLTDVTIPDSVTTIGDAAFYYCLSLTSVAIPDSVTSIGDSAFQNCDSLTEIVFHGDAPIIDEYSFDYISATAYYPSNNATWTDDVMLNYGGTITWVPYTPEPEPTEPTPTEPKPTEPKPTEPTPTEPAVNFTDVTKDKWFYDTVQWAVDNGITNGTTATTFAPDDTCTRNQVVTFLWRAEGEPEPASTNNPFVDVKESDYFYKAVLWAVENGITNGMDATHFDPNGKCTRGQVVTFLHRAAGKPAPKSTDNPFTDVGQDYYTDAVLWAVGEGITDGMTPTTFEPNTTCTRAQIVTFLNRAYT